MCGTSLAYTDMARIYCSARCRQRAYRRRKAEGTIEDEAALAAIAGSSAQLRRLRLTVQRVLRTEALGAPVTVRRGLHFAVRECKRYEDRLQEKAASW